MSSPVAQPRPLIVGGEQITSPYPVFLSGPVQRGFGRGSKELGIPTANLPEQVVHDACSNLTTGVYFGWAQVDGGPVYGMVMSLGWNPYYKNEKLSGEVHILNEYPQDFYGKPLKVVVLGYLRPERDYTSLDALIYDINVDITVAKNSMARAAYCAYRSDPFFESA
ncbi:riboflavin kinase [Tieghemiomyces parasiticus]|uniref:Riboflavin kinase n=1 Tax=Tieghemiomyces parasiticus TaxID=78921 RepID=A0A9W8A7U9_9FUNG|nr:riboflavin kinase [Tieghemiomyces parasiticus]